LKRHRWAKHKSFTRIRGDMKSSRNISRLMVIALLSGLLTTCGIKQPINTPTPTETTTPKLTLTLTNTIAPTLTLTNTIAPTFTETSAPSIVGKWERHGKQNDRPYTEHFALNPGGTYSIEAIFDNTGKILSSTYGTYNITQTTLALTDKDNKTTNSPYYLDPTGNKLIINNQPEFAWKRLQ
jgi:predicted small lipoprotein YifL